MHSDIARSPARQPGPNPDKTDATVRDFRQARDIPPILRGGGGADAAGRVRYGLPVDSTDKIADTDGSAD